VLAVLTFLDSHWPDHLYRPGRRSSCGCRRPKVSAPHA